MAAKKMKPQTKYLFSSVVRGAQQGESHGGLYIADFKDRSCTQVFDHNSPTINFSGRGADRGLRGIALGRDKVYLAASDEIFVFSTDFNLLDSFCHPLLKHAHEICLTEAGLFVVSTGYNSILLFDTATAACTWGLKIETSNAGNIRAVTFDPSQTHLSPDTSSHLNMVSSRGGSLFVSGRKLPSLIEFQSTSGIRSICTLPFGTHNAQPWGRGVIFNDTEKDQVVWVQRDHTLSIPLPRFNNNELDHPIARDERVARAHFGRGLQPVDDQYVVAGSSPSTLSLLDFENGEIVQKITATKDIRNAVHGLIAWPF
ncbi:MAG: hypothetical protein AAF870_02455 [Pseudomonadota bacterium]